MKKKEERILTELGQIDDALIKKSESPLSPEPKKPKKSKKSNRKWIRWTAPVAGLLTVALVMGFFFGRHDPLSDQPYGDPLALNAYALAQASYPQMAQFPQRKGDDRGDRDKYNAQYDAWRNDRAKQRDYYGAGEGLDHFFSATLSEFLKSEKGENKVYSPLNVYMALGMLAEISDGNSRAQVLDLLGSDSIEALRSQAFAIWNANYRDDGAVTTILASSLWLNQDLSFRQDTLNKLAETYYASSYRGEMGSDEFNQAFHSWLNQRTGGLLKRQIDEIELYPDTLMALATTVYYQAKWDTEFYKQFTDKGIFHSANGDLTCDFMHQSEPDNYYWGTHFSATAKSLDAGGGTMWFILPNEGSSVEDLLNDEEVLAFALSNGKWEHKKEFQINLAVPKFDVQSQIDLIDGLKKLGVTDCFDPTVSDFSPLLTDPTDAAITRAQHGARVIIDEEGVTAAAYTVMAMDEGIQIMDEKIDFILDRPFLFVLTGEDGLPLFAGVVNQPA